MAGRLWAAKDEQALRKLYDAYMRHDISREQLCRALGRTYHSIMHKAGQLGLTGKAESEMDEDYYKKLVTKLEL